MSPDYITSGAYNMKIDKRLARHMVWLRETSEPVANQQLSKYGDSVHKTSNGSSLRAATAVKMKVSGQFEIFSTVNSQATISLWCNKL